MSLLCSFKHLERLQHVLCDPCGCVRTEVMKLHNSTQLGSLEGPLLTDSFKIVLGGDGR